MNNSKHKAKRLSVALLIAVLAVSTSFASVMTGCGNKDESSSTAATVTSTASAAENTTVANDKSESEVTSESSNSQSSGSESKSESAQSSEKSESSGSSDSSKANSNSNNNSSSKAANNNSNNNSGITTGYDYTKGGEMVVVTFEATADGSSKVNWLWQSASTIDEKNNLVYHIDNNGKSDGTVSLSTSYK